MQIENLKDIETVLARYIPVVKEITGKDITLTRMQPLMERLGNPQNNLKIIHIAGTSGKTSTAYYVAALLQAAGQKVGLTVSPHVDSVAERVQINLKPLDDKTMASAFEEFMEIIQDVQPVPSYFELLIGFVYWYFAQSKVDYAVIETGLGGLHDATNVASNEDKICVITDIGYDHMHILGYTLDRIATQKAGVIYPHNDVLCYRQAAVIHQVIVHTTREKNGHLHIVEPHDDQASQDLPLFQQRNWHLAKATFDLVAKRDNLPELSSVTQRTAAHIVVPARMEVIVHGTQNIILDGSHNAQKISALVDSLLAKYPGKSFTILTSFVSTKHEHIVEDIEQLKRLNAPLIITSFSGAQDTPHYSMNAEDVQVEAAKQGVTSNIIQSPEVAFEKLLQHTEDILLVTGSFYLLNHIRPLIINRND